MTNPTASVEQWPESELEHLDRCPVCGARQARKLYEQLYDRLYGAPGYWTLYQCENCVSGYLNPRPTPESIGKAYEHYSTHEISQVEASEQRSGWRRLRVAIRNGYLNRRYGYEAKPSLNWGHAVMFLLPPPLRLEWDAYARHLPRPEPGRNRLLDFGCGNGEFLLRARQAGWEVEGLDFDPKAAAIARSCGLKVWVGDYRRAPFPESSFDAITSHQVIEHVHNPAEFVSRLANWLKPGGTLWIGTPNFASVGRKLFGRDWRHLHPPQHLGMLTSNALLALFADSGLSARTCRRGYHEAHIVSESLALRHGAVSIDEVSAGKSKYRRRSLSLVLELIAWIWPRFGSDMIIIGKKPT